MSAFYQTARCKMSGCAGLDYFGRLVEEHKKDSKGVRELFHDLNFHAFDVIDDVMVQMTNSSTISILNENNTEYMHPLYEMGDCPVFEVPEGLGATSKIM